MPVALLVEGVGRNKMVFPRKFSATASPSSWRAWVEIGRVKGGGDGQAVVALLVEGVGRNTVLIESTDGKKRRPPRGGRG